MDRKQINIFLASSINDVAYERTEIGDFFGKLNNAYRKKGIYLNLIKCEQCDSSISLNGKQYEYDNMIRESDMVFFVFFNTVGEYTIHEFFVANENMKKYGNPQIITYFRYIDSLDNVNNLVKTFMDTVKETNNYYNIYNETDTLKLGILMQIKRLNIDDSEISIKNGRMYINDSCVLNVRKAPIFTKNTNLAKLRNKYDELYKKYSELKKTAGSSEEILSLKTNLDEFEKLITALEKKILYVFEKMLSRMSKRELSSRQIKSYNLFQQGDTEQALSVLEYNDIIKDIDWHQNYAERCKIHFDELQMRTELLSSIADDGQVYAEKEKINSLAEQYGIKLNDK